MTDLVPQAVRDLLAFYTERYPEVRFGDLDLAVLSRAVESIDEAAKEVLAAEEAVAAARAQFRGIESELTQKAVRALSFLKIFVDGDAEQLAALDAIAMAMPATRRKTKAAADAGSGEAPKRRTRKSRNAEGTENEADTKDAEASAAVEAELEKAGLSESELSDLGIAETLAAEPKPVAKSVAAE
jgi:hypothetical protein